MTQAIVLEVIPSPQHLPALELVQVAEELLPCHHALLVSRVWAS